MLPKSLCLLIILLLSVLFTFFCKKENINNTFERWELEMLLPHRACITIFFSYPISIFYFILKILHNEKAYMEKASDSNLTQPLTAWPWVSYLSSLIYLIGNYWVLTRLQKFSWCTEPDERTSHNLRQRRKQMRKLITIQGNKFCDHFITCSQWNPRGM